VFAWCLNENVEKDDLTWTIETDVGLTPENFRSTEPVKKVRQYLAMKWQAEDIIADVNLTNSPP
jgi:hypothetical protein